MARKIEVMILGDTSSLDRALGKTSSSMQRVGRAAGVAGLAIAAGLGIAAKIGWDEMAAGQKIAAQTNAVLKSTGGVANVTAKHVDELSQSLMKKSGVDDETIRSGENLLLTFRGIRNEVGQGNDIFDQATEATLDLSVAMGKDMSDSAIVVGKALQDPIRGLTALRRVGIQFTAAQEEQIKKMVEAGNVMGAQKLILKELNTEFGGSAEAVGKTLPGKISILKESFADLAGEMLTALLPAITVVVQQLASFAGFLIKHKTLAAALAIGLAVLAGALMALSVATTIATIAMAPLAAAIGVIVLALAAVAIGLVIAYKKSQTFQAIVGAAIDFVRLAWKALLALIPVIAPLLTLIISRFGTIKSVGVAAFNAVKATVEAVIGAVGNAIARVSAFIARVRDITSKPFNDLKEAVGNVIERVGDAIARVGAFVGRVRDVTAGPFSAVASAISSVVSWANSAISAISRLASAIRSIPIPRLPGLPNIPGFAKGGVVPGPAGAARLIMAHGGETVLPAGGGSYASHITVELDGQVLWQGLKRHAIRDQTRNGTTGIR